MSALTSDRDRRGAQRLALPKPVPATLGGFPGRLLEFSLTGCAFEHVDRVLPKTTLALKFKWRGSETKISATVIRSEMRAVKGKATYISGLEFCASTDDSPAVVREIVTWLTGALKPKVEEQPQPAAQPSPAPQTAIVDDEPEELAAPYLQCTFASGQWMKLYVDDPKQPTDGFTILAPANEAEADVLCRAYQRAGAEGRRAMRASFELAIARSRKAS